MKAVAPQQRTLHFVDIENLGESAILTEGLVRQIKKEYLEAVRPNSGDLYVLGVSHFNLTAASFGWGSGVAQYVFQSGENGADLALLKVIGDSDITRRFNCVNIGSGDGIFAEIGVALRRQGFKVSFVARQYAISGGIYRSGCDCLVLPSLNDNQRELELVS